MQRIRIYENDNTANRVVSGVTPGAIFIPGFASAAASEETQAKQGVFVECNSTDEFTAAFGSSAPEFKANSNVYPYSGIPTVAAMVENYATLESTYPTKNVVGYDSTKTYAINSYCIQDKKLQRSIIAIETAEEFNQSHWEIILVSDSYIKIISDETRDGRTTYYQYTVTTTKNAISGTFTYKEFNKPGFPKRALPMTTEQFDPNNIQMFKEDYDPSWTMAFMLLSAGYPVVYVRMNASLISTDDNYDVTPAQAYEYMHSTIFKADEYNMLLDKNFNIEFLTSGGYPVLEHNYNIDQQMIAIASSKDTKASHPEGFCGRGDCVALLDHTNNPYRSLISDDSVFKCDCVPESNYASVFTPWCTANINKMSEIPASFVYLYTLASKGTASSAWNPIAGVSRGRCSLVTALNTEQTLTNKIAESYQNDYGLTSAEHPSINPITYIRNFGFCLWGDRTCECYKSENKGFALSFLHVRNLVSEVKKKAFLVSQELMFSVNDETLWTKFKSKMQGLLDQMVAGNGLKGYTFERDLNTGDDTLLSATIVLYPSYGLEKVEVSINLENNADTATISES